MRGRRQFFVLCFLPSSWKHLAHLLVTALPPGPSPFQCLGLDELHFHQQEFIHTGTGGGGKGKGSLLLSVYSLRELAGWPVLVTKVVPAWGACGTVIYRGSQGWGSLDVTIRSGVVGHATCWRLNMLFKSDARSVRPAVLGSPGKVVSGTRESSFLLHSSLFFQNSAKKQDLFLKVISKRGCIERDFGLSQPHLPKILGRKSLSDLLYGCPVWTFMLLFSLWEFLLVPVMLQGELDRNRTRNLFV